MTDKNGWRYNHEQTLKQARWRLVKDWAGFIFMLGFISWLLSKLKL
jgi:hypothetical protein